MNSQITIKYSNFAKIAAQMPRAVSKIVRKTALDVEATAKQIAPVDTGNLKNSIITETPEPLSAIVGPHTDYALYVEFGTSKMSAQPYMTPAAQKHRAPFVTACSRLEGSLK